MAYSINKNAGGEPPGCQWFVENGPYPSAEEVHRGSVEDRRDRERAAWARLVRALRCGWFATNGEEHSAAARDIETAEQALRDLGVDVDALLSD